MAKRGYKLQEHVAHTSDVNCLCIGKKTCRICVTGGDDCKVNLWAIGKPTSLLTLKSGPLFISSKVIGWTSWKKRWFVLTRTSLVFYRTDPNAVLQKRNEANLTLGGIDLNNSGSIVVKADKKLLTVLFPDGRDGRAFTVKAETSEELNDWKAALENALAQAPSPALVMGQNPFFRNEIVDSAETSFEQWRDRRPVKSLVVWRPILLALEDIDGSPSFLEKALRFIEEYGIKVEGIFRQSADVEEVERRVQEYEQGKDEFSSDEDAHVIGDCIKHVLRELPSSPVPASCCTALVEAYRTECGARLNALRAAISETFPEPNRRLVQRILKMMRIVASHKSQNGMSLSALAACMAPLLLRAPLAGDCELENDFNMGGDGSLQLLQAAAAANHAQAIVIILLEEYEKIFDDELLEDGSVSSEIYTESEAEDYDIGDDEFTANDILEDDGYHDAQNDMDAGVEDDPECSSSGSPSETGSDVESDLSEDKVTDEHNTESTSPKDHEFVETTRTSSSTTPASTLKDYIMQKPSSTTNILNTQEAGPKTDGVLQKENSNNSLAASSYDAHESTGNVTSASPVQAEDVIPASPIQNRVSQKASSISNLSEKSKEPMSGGKRPTVWGRTPARKNLSMEAIDYCSKHEIAIQTLEKAKSDLETKFREEVDGNSILQASLERQKETLHEHRLAFEKDAESSYNDSPSVSTQLFHSEVSNPKESIVEATNLLDESNKALASSIQHSNPAALEDGLIQFGKDIERANSVVKSNILKLVSAPRGSKDAKNPRQSFGGDEPLSTPRLEENLGATILESQESAISEAEGLIIDSSVGEIDLSNMQVMDNEDLVELKELGSGGFGTVYHGKWRGIDVAIKRIKKSSVVGQQSRQYRLILESLREAGILSKLQHPNVVSLYGFVLNEASSTLAIVTELVGGGSLRNILHREDIYLDHCKRLAIAKGAASGMEYLHLKNIVHFDLKCDNLLVDLNNPSCPICKVTDFGLSKIKKNTLVTGSFRGTLPWMAPELLKRGNNKVSEKIDVYSFGIVMWEILTGKVPYDDMPQGEILGGMYDNTLRPPVPASCDPEWRELMEQCWDGDPQQRPSFNQIASRLHRMLVVSQAEASERWYT